MRIVQRTGIILAIVALGLLGWAHTALSSSQVEQRAKPAPARPENRNNEALLRELEQMYEQRQYNDILQRTQQAAQERGAPSIFLNHYRARALHSLRPQDPAQREELIQLWETVRQSYQNLGYAPGQVEATLALAFCYWQTDRARAEQLLNDAFKRADADADLPLEVAKALGSYAKDWFEIQEWSICQRLWERALALQEAHGAEELTLAQTRYNLGVLALKQNQLETAQARLRDALAVQQSLAPDTAELASTLLALGELAQRRDQLTEAQNFYQRALAIHTANLLSAPETAQIHLGLADVARQQRRWSDAQTHYERALQIAEAIDPQLREAARAQAGLGVVALEQGALDAAKQRLQSARQNPNLDPLEQAQIDHELGRVAWRDGKLNDAVSYLTHALERQRSLQDAPLNIAKTLYNLGALALERGELPQARECFTQTLAIREGESPRSLPVAHTLMGLGFVAFYEGNLFDARRLFEQARDLYETLNAEPTDRSRALTALGLVAVEQGELDRAQGFLEHALQLQEENRLIGTALHAQTRIGLGNLYLRRGGWDEAARHYRRAHEIASNAPSLLRAQALIGLGNLAFRQRDLRKAEMHYKEALNILESNFPNSPLVFQMLLNMGMVALEAGDADLAQSYFEDAERKTPRIHASHLTERVRLNSAIMQIRRGDTANTLSLLNQLVTSLQRPSGNQLLLGQAHFYRGVVRARQGDIPAAREDFNRALALYQQVAPNTIFVALTQLNLAKQDYRAGDAPRARARLSEAIAIIERQRALILDPDLQAAFSENYYEAYSLLALLEAEQGNAARAAELLEQSRARALLEQIQRTQVEPLNPSPEWRALQSQWQALEAERIETRRQIATIHAASEQGAETPEAAEVKARPLYERLTHLEQRQQQLEDELRTRFPNEARLLTPPPMNFVIIQQQLDPNVALIYHALVENNLLIVVVTKQSVRAHYQAVDSAPLFEEIRAFQSEIQENREAITAELIEQGARLYQTLVAPVADILSGYERVLLCPEGELNQLPWAALVVETPAGKPVYWMERVAIHLTPSMGVYRYARHPRPLEPASHGVLVAAVSKYETEPALSAQQTPDAVPAAPEQLPAPTQVAQQGTRGAGLNNLPAAEKEALSIERLIPNTIVLREDEVQPERVREQARVRRILHFACHAEAKDENPLESVLKFDARGERWLTAAQIMAHWRLQADLVMLSACETARGKVYRYEGVYGLARAFLHAGAKSVGATLWQVEDESTAQLVEEFYKGYIVRKLPKDRALQQAQRRMLQQGYAPYYWSGFVLIGDCR